jgi:hypothetical protein
VHPPILHHIVLEIRPHTHIERQAPSEQDGDGSVRQIQTALVQQTFNQGIPQGGREGEPPQMRGFQQLRGEFEQVPVQGGLEEEEEGKTGGKAVEARVGTEDVHGHV